MLSKKMDSNNYGVVVQVRDEVVSVVGLYSVGINEKVSFVDVNLQGMVRSLTSENGGSVKICVLGNAWEIEPGMWVERTKQIMSIPVSLNFIGRIISPTGVILSNMFQPLLEYIYWLDTIDNEGISIYNDNGSIESAVENSAPSIVRRKSVKESLETGIKFVDSMIPIGCGQRELIIGDKKTGKTCIATDIIINQKNSEVNTFCIYVAIGQKKSSVALLSELLCWQGCFLYTTIVSATSADASGLQFIAPYSGATIGEYFAYKGYRSVIIYDDLSKHAVAYRQMSLLLRRPPGREGYPGDVFYLHSRLLERSAKLNEFFSLGMIYSLWNYKNVKISKFIMEGGSLTAFPIIETIQGDVSAYIPTNVISITDGQIYLEIDLFNRGIRPAISPGISVSRIGGSAQNKIIRGLSGPLKLELAQFREMEDFVRLGFALDAASAKLMDRGAKLMKLMTQPYGQPMSMAAQILLLFGGLHGYFEDLDIDEMPVFEEQFLCFLDNSSFVKPLIGAARLNLDFDVVLVNYIINVFKLFYQKKN